MLRTNEIQTSDMHGVPLLRTELRQHQLDGISKIEQFGGRCLVADEQGCGKSLLTLSYVFKHFLFPAVIICPATLKHNWMREINRHFPDKKKGIQILSGSTPLLLTRGDSDINTGRIYILNYDILYKWIDELKKIQPAIVIADESAAVRNPTAKRTIALLDLTAYSDKFLALTGTPIQNNPMELYPTLKMIFGKDIMSHWQYRNRYCVFRDVQYGRKRVCQYVASRNLPELNALLREKCMLRRKSSEVLSLPPYTRTTLLYQMTPAQRKEYAFLKADFIGWLRKNYPEKKPPKSTMQLLLMQFGYMKRETAIWKYHNIVEWIETFLENTQDEKLIVFGVHHKIIDPLYSHFKNKHKKNPATNFDVVQIHGKVSSQERNNAVEKFQTDPHTRLFVGQIHACGTGLTLTAASHTLFAELDFVPANHLQAECRNYRIGTHKPVFWHYYLVEDTIEEKVAQLLFRKQNTFNGVVDGHTTNNDVFALLEELTSDKSINISQSEIPDFSQPELFSESF